MTRLMQKPRCHGRRNRLLEWLLATGIILALPACTKTVPGPAVPVSIPVPVPCVPVEVPQPELPKATADMGLFRLVVTALAQKEILEGDAERLRAANTNPCPEVNE